MDGAKIDVVIPLWNEEKNIEALVTEMAAIWNPQNGFNRLYLVNNGSTDGTAEILNKIANLNKFITVVHLDKNLNYGGGIYEGFKYTRAEYVGYIPGDLQVSPSDLEKVWRELIRARNIAANRPLFFKGARLERHDKFSTRLVSFVYTKIVKIILGLRVRDINGLPKVFDRRLLDLLPEYRMVNFVFDSQLMAVAAWSGWQISEVPVVFHARREGISSWSGKRLKTYFESFKMVLRLRSLKGAASTKIELKNKVEDLAWK